MINTILVEDDIYMQKHFSAILGSDERFSVAGTFRDAFEVESRCGTDIDLVLMDVLTLHKHSGLAAGGSARGQKPRWRVLSAAARAHRPERAFRGETRRG